MILDPDWRISQIGPNFIKMFLKKFQVVVKCPNKPLIVLRSISKARLKVLYTFFF